MKPDGASLPFDLRTWLPGAVGWGQVRDDSVIRVPTRGFYDPTNHTKPTNHTEPTNPLPDYHKPPGNIGQRYKENKKKKKLFEYALRLSR